MLKFNVIEEYNSWAVESGPLMISNDGGNREIALFDGKPQDDDVVKGFIRLAFRVDAGQFIDFINTSGSWSDKPLTKDEIKDQNKSMSVYFANFYSNLLEVTTYDYNVAKNLS